MNVTLPIHRQALNAPDRAALITERQTLSYAELDRALWRGAAYFHSLGLSAGQCVAVCIPEPLLHVVATLTLVRLGVGYVPVAASDSAWLVKNMMQRIGARCLIHSRAIPAIPGCAHLAIDRASFISGGEMSENVLSEQPDRPWRFFTSSGTTAQPKLAVLDHATSFHRFERYRLAFPRRRVTFASSHCPRPRCSRRC